MNEVEFCWKVEPARGRRWQKVYSTHGFHVEISGDHIFVRAESPTAHEGELRGRAEGIARNLARAMRWKLERREGKS